MSRVSNVCLVELDSKYVCWCHGFCGYDHHSIPKMKARLQGINEGRAMPGSPFPEPACPAEAKPRPEALGRVVAAIVAITISMMTVSMVMMCMMAK